MTDYSRFRVLTEDNGSAALCCLDDGFEVLLSLPFGEVVAMADTHWNDCHAVATERFTVTKAGPHHVVTGQTTPHHEDDCTPECDMFDSITARMTTQAVEFDPPRRPGRTKT